MRLQSVYLMAGLTLNLCQRMLELIKIQFKGGEMFLLRSCSTWLTKMSATENNRTDGSQINLNEHEQAKNKCWVKYKKMLRCLDSWVVSHLALNISLLHHALGHEFKPWWWQTLFQNQAHHLCFLHDCSWFFDMILLFVCHICHVNCETGN